MVHYTKQKSKDLATQLTKNYGAFGCFETVFSSFPQVAPIVFMLSKIQ